MLLTVRTVKQLSRIRIQEVVVHHKLCLVLEINVSGPASDSWQDIQCTAVHSKKHVSPPLWMETPVKQHETAVCRQNLRI